jgi:excinuclease ABC subunit C
MVDSVLDGVSGIGPARKKALLRRFGSLKRIREAEIDQLKEVLPNDVAERLHGLLHGTAVVGSV